MLAQNKQLLVVMALVMAPLACLALPGLAPAAQRGGPILRKGVYDGIWHTDPVQFIIEKINPDGSFKGELHFDPNGRWGDARCGITGQLGRDDSITIQRDDCPEPTTQIARAPRAELRGRSMVWKGEVTGRPADAPEWKASFELRAPLR